MKTTTPYPTTHCRMAALIPALLITISIMISPSRSLAAAFTWSGGGGDDNWSTGANWIGGAAPDNDGTADIIFTGATRLTPNVDAAWDVHSLTFDASASAFTIGGSSLTVQGDNSVNSNVITNSAGQTQTINNAIVVATKQGWQNTNAAGTLILNGAISSDVEFRVNNSAGQVDLNGVVSGTGVFKKNGEGTMTVSGANTFNGFGPTVFNGALLIGADSPDGGAGAFGNSFSPVFLGFNGDYSASLLTSSPVTVGRRVQVTTGNSVGAGAVIGGNSADNSTFSGDVILGTNNQAATAATFTAVSGGRVEFTGDLVRATNATGTGDNVTKTGAGTVVFSGAGNAYQGTTTVSAGTLLINGTLDNSGGTVTVNAGAILGGTGDIQRNLSIDGTLATGDGGIGTLGSAGVVFNNGSAFAFDINTTSVTSDLLNANGNFDLSGTVALSLSDLGANAPLANGTKLTLASYSGSWNNGIFDGLADDSQFSFGANTFAINYNDTSGDGLYGNFATLTVVPEPAVLGLLLGAGTFLLLGRRRRS